MMEPLTVLTIHGVFALNARRVNVNTIVIDGFEETANKKDLKAAGEDYAEWVQEQVAILYAKESSAGGKFSPNDPHYTQWKIDHGYPEEIGQLTGNTLSVLENEDLMRVDVRGRKKKYRVIVSILRNVFYRKVGEGNGEVKSYIEYFERAKVPNETICALKSSWARNARNFFEE